MAGEGDGKFDPRRAVSLLQEATKLLSEYPCSSSDSSQHAQSSHSTVESANQSTTGNKIVDTTSGNFSRERVLGNFRNLFAPYGNNRRSISSSTQSVNPRKKRKPNAVSFKRETWTHTFFCLDNQEQCTPPSTALKEKLQNAGLGRKKICFNCKANAMDVKAKLEEEYPKLKESGGFDILRRGAQTSELVCIQPPRSGYSVPFLRDSAMLGQAVAFIRPIQKNLDTTPAPAIDDDDVVGFKLFFENDFFNANCFCT